METRPEFYTQTLGEIYIYDVVEESKGTLRERKKKLKKGTERNRKVESTRKRPFQEPRSDSSTQIPKRNQ